MKERYDESGDVHLHGYSGTLTAYAASVGAAVALGRFAGRDLPDRYPASDVVLGGMAVHKLSRILAKGSVASPVRAPFTRLQQATGAAEHQDAARGEAGVRHTIGELLTCPFCLGVWLATAYVGGLTVGPRVTRTLAATFSVVALSDWLQLGYEAMRDRALGD